MIYAPGVQDVPGGYHSFEQPLQQLVYSSDVSRVVIYVADRNTRLDAMGFRYSVANAGALWGRLVILGDGVTNPLLGTDVTDELSFTAAAGTFYAWNLKEDSRGWHPVLEAGEALAIVWDSRDSDPVPEGSGADSGSATGTLTVPGALRNLLIRVRLSQSLG